MAAGELTEEAIKYLKSLDDPTRELLVQAFERAVPALSLTSLAARVAQETGQSSQQVEKVSLSFGSWYELIYADPSWVERIVQFILPNAQQGTAGEGTAVPAQPEERGLPLIGHVRRLLQCESSLGATSKAQSIVGRNERIFRDAKIVTEIRPVFPRDVKEGTKNAVIVHHLRISYYEHGQEKEIYIAADIPSLGKLDRELVHAWEKEQALRSQSLFQYLTQE